MKYYSELLKKNYNTEAECLEAEKTYTEEQLAKEKEEKERQETRKARAAEIEDARKAMSEAQKKYADLINDFVKDYGSWHTSVRSFDDVPHLFESFFNLL